MTDRIEAETVETREMNRDPITGSPGSHPVGTGLGAAGGAAAGVAVGLMAGGPIGTAIGGAVGAIVGGLAGKGVGEAVNPTGEEAEVVEVVGTPATAVIEPYQDELYWQRAFITEPYYNSELSYDDYAPAYRAGFLHRRKHLGMSWEESEDALRSEWERTRGASRLSWDDAYQPMRAAWYRAHTDLTTEDPYFGVN